MPATKPKSKKSAAHAVAGESDLAVQLEAAKAELKQHAMLAQDLKKELESARSRVSQLESHLEQSYRMRNVLLAQLQEARTLLSFVILHWQATPIGKALLRAQTFLNGTRPQPGEERPAATPLDAPDGRTM